MISTFLVKEGKTETSRLVAAFASGAVLTSGGTGAAVAACGNAAGVPRGHTALIVLGVIIAGLAVADATGRTPTVRRQTKSHWWITAGPRGAAFIWGADLGFGFNTIRIASIYWIAVLTAFCFEGPSGAAVSFSFYGIGLTANLILGITALRQRFGNRVLLAATGLARPISRVTAVGLAGAALILIAEGVLNA